MTKDDIMKLALESGFAKILDEHASEYRNFTFELSQDHYPELERFANLVAAHKAMRMPKVGDKVICLEDESLGEVVSLTAGGSPDILFDDGSHGTYLLREFAELFSYAEQRQWVGLTEEDRCKFAAAQYGWEDLCLAVEAKLKEKNHG